MKTNRILFTVMLAAFSFQVFAGLKDGLTFYEDCDDSKSSYTDVKIASSIQAVRGKFGNAFRIERRTVNEMPNGDFKEKESEFWLYRDNAQWQARNGRNDSSCLKIEGGEVALPLFGLQKKYGNAFSFYAKSSKNKEITAVRVTYEALGKETLIVQNLKLANQFIRIEAPFIANSEEGTLRIYVKGSILIDDAQLDKGVTFFNSYCPPLKRRGVDQIILPPDGHYYNEESGSLNCWVKGPWVQPGLIATTSALFGVHNESKENKWGSTSVMFISCIPKPYFGAEDGALHFITIDAKRRVAGLSESNLAKLPPLAEDEWRMFSFTWDYRDGNMHQVLFLDGKKLFGKDVPFGPLKKPSEITIGHSGGAYLNGCLDDIAIYNRPLSEKEIKMIYNSGKPLGAIIK